MSAFDQMLDPDGPLEQQNRYLRDICQVLLDQLPDEAAKLVRQIAPIERLADDKDRSLANTSDLKIALDQLHLKDHDLRLAKLKAETAERNMSDAIEAISQGFGLFDARGVLVMKNSRFCQSFPDVKDKIQPGIQVTEFFDVIAQSRFLDTTQAGGREAWQKDRLRRYIEPDSTFNVRHVGDRWTKVSQHKTLNNGTVILQTDVTDIMRLQEVERSKLVDRQAQFIRATLEHLAQGICIFDSKARLVGWNQRMITLLNASEADFDLGQDFESLYFQIEPEFDGGDEEWARRIRAWVLAKRPRPILNFDVRGRQQQILDVHAQEMPDGGFLFSLTDVTAERNLTRTMARTNEMLERRVADRTLELQSAMEAAKRANASKSRFVAAASHDVLQPLSAAKLFLASINKADLPGQVDTVVTKTQDALTSIEGILGALLEISKLEIDENALDVEHIALGPIFQRMANEFSPSAAAKGLSFSLVPCAAVVRTDAEFLQRILRNLISNAIRYTEEGRVLIGARRDGAGLRIEVHDTGRGIAPDEQRAIFREFYRSDSATSTAEGIGLGLAIVERACQRLGHPLGLRSEIGKGTVFHFTIPLSDRTSRADPHRTPHNSGLTLEEGLVVMLVEHDEAHRRAMTLLLEKWNVSVLAVGSAQEAEALLDELQLSPDTFLVDYNLDESGDGIDLISRLQARFESVPGCILSADRSRRLSERCKAASLTILHKPIEPNALGAFLQTLRPAEMVARPYSHSNST